MESVDKGDLRVVVDELGEGLRRRRERPAAAASTAGTPSPSSATEALPETVKLIDDGRIVLDTQRDTAQDIRVFSTNFADLSETLKASDGDLRLILDRGAVASRELDGLIKENQGNLAALLANFITIGQVTTTRVDGIEQLLVTYPDVVAGGYTVVPGDGTAHFGLAMAQEPKVCTQGYEGTQPHRPEPDHEPAPGQHRGTVHAAPRVGQRRPRLPERPRPLAPGVLQLLRPSVNRRPARIPGHRCVVGHGSTRRLGAPPAIGRWAERAVVAVDHEGGCSMSTITTQAGRAVTISRLRLRGARTDSQEAPVDTSRTGTPSTRTARLRPKVLWALAALVLVAAVALGATRGREAYTAHQTQDAHAEAVAAAQAARRQLRDGRLPARSTQDTARVKAGATGTSSTSYTTSVAS